MCHSVNKRWTRLRVSHVSRYLQATKALRESRGIALLCFFGLAIRRRWGVSVTPRPHSTLVKDPVPIVQEGGWAPGPVWTGAENITSIGIRLGQRFPTADHRWSSGSALVVLLDWTLVQKKKKKKINVNCISHTVVENLKQFAFKADKSRVVRRTFWLIKVVPTWKKFGKRWSRS
jgi:hypothetical protein